MTQTTSAPRIPSRLATRHSCSLRYDALAGHRHSEGSGRGPASGKCLWCKGRLVIATGLWGTFTWRGDGRYWADGALALSSREPVAGPDWVERNLVSRWIPMDELPVPISGGGA